MYLVQTVNKYLYLDISIVYLIPADYFVSICNALKDFFQVEKATAVADEAVGNIRTVRAFAMEDCERELFDAEAEYAMILNQKLGAGIGFFQAGTNLFLNG